MKRKTLKRREIIYIRRSNANFSSLARTLLKLNCLITYLLPASERYEEVLIWFKGSGESKRATCNMTLTVKKLMSSIESKHDNLTRLFLRPWVMEWNSRCPALSDAWLHLTWRVNLNNCLAWIKILNDEFAQTFVIVDHIKNVISETSDLFRRNSFLNITDLLVGNRGEKSIYESRKADDLSLRITHSFWLWIAFL